MFLRSIRVAAVTACFALVAASASAQTKLEYKYKKGDALVYEMVQNMNMNQNVAGNEIATKMTQTMEIEQTVLDVTNDGAKIRNRFRRMKMEMDAPAPIGRVVVDSEAKEDSDVPGIGKILSDVVRSMAKVEFVTTMTPDGDVKDVEISEEVAKVFRELPGGGQLGNFGSKDGLKEMMMQSGIVFPNEAMPVGHRWERKASISSPIGKMTTTMKYVYKGKDGNTERVDYTTDVSNQADPKKAAGPMVTINSQKGSGSVFFDPAAGRLQELRLNQTMEMSIGVMGLNVTSNVDQNITMKLKTK